MTDALRKMVEAMCAELARQAEDSKSGDFAAETGKEAEMRLDGYFDLEKVARAGLEAIKEPDEALMQAALDVDLAAPYFQCAEADEHWRAMVTAILEPEG